MVQFILDELMPAKNEAMKWAARGFGLAADISLIYVIVYWYIQ